jgi:uncharacterized damage-inducible protein DinB
MKSMQKDILHAILLQNETRFWALFNQVTAENVELRLNSRTASAGFICRHVSETMIRLGNFIGVPSNVENTTIGQQDKGQGRNIEASRALAEQGFEMLRNYIDSTPDTAWMELIETPFFGTVPRVRMFSHILFHNYYHIGQLGLTLAKGELNA